MHLLFETNFLRGFVFCKHAKHFGPVFSRQFGLENEAFLQLLTLILRAHHSFKIINAFISFIQEFFSDDYINDIEQEFDRVRWYEAEIFRIHNCRTLRLRLDDGRDSLSDYFRQKILIIEDIEELELQTFLVGKVPSSSSYGTVMINECLYTRVR